MSRDELRAAGERLVGQARAVRAAFPDRGAMAAVAVPPLGPPPVDGDATWAALGFLRDEVVLVQAGGTTTLSVLDDELANAERVLARAGLPAAGDRRSVSPR